MAHVLFKIANEITGNVEYVKGETYNDIVWIDEQGDKSTEEAINLAIQNYNAGKPLEQLRKIRNVLLQESDYKLLSDYPIPSGKLLSDMITYRQELRDLPTQFTNITSIDQVVFPTIPY